jgi:hypothetical protein
MDYITFIDTLAQSENLIRFLRDLLADDSRVQDLAKQSEAHRLGFDKIILEMCSIYQLHLHIWWPREQAFKDGIHNHKFNFTSKILKGSLAEEIYERCDSGGIFMHEYLALSNESKSTDRFQYKGYQQICCCRKTTYPAGTTYFLHNSAFHNAVPNDHKELTITLFIRTANVKNADTIFEEQPFATDGTNVKVPNIVLTADEYRERILKVIDLFS